MAVVMWQKSLPANHGPEKTSDSKEEERLTNTSKGTQSQVKRRASGRAQHCKWWVGEREW